MAQKKTKRNPMPGWYNRIKGAVVGLRADGWQVVKADMKKKALQFKKGKQTMWLTEAKLKKMGRNPRKAKGKVKKGSGLELVREERTKGAAQTYAAFLRHEGKQVRVRKAGSLWRVWSGKPKKRKNPGKSRDPFARPYYVWYTDGHYRTIYATSFRKARTKAEALDRKDKGLALHGGKITEIEAAWKDNPRRAKKRKNPLLMVVPNGFEKRVHGLIERDAPMISRRDYHFYRGDFIVDTPSLGSKIARVLNRSQLFGHATWHPKGHPHPMISFKFLRNRGGSVRKNPLLMVVPNKGRKGRFQIVKGPFLSRQEAALGVKKLKQLGHKRAQAMSVPGPPYEGVWYAVVEKTKKASGNPLLMVVPNGRLPRRIFSSDRAMNSFRCDLKKNDEVAQFFTNKKDAKTYIRKLKKAGRFITEVSTLKTGYVVVSMRQRGLVPTKVKKNPSARWHMAEYKDAKTGMLEADPDGKTFWEGAAGAHWASYQKSKKIGPYAKKNPSKNRLPEDAVDYAFKLMAKGMSSSDATLRAAQEYGYGMDEVFEEMRSRARRTKRRKAYPRRATKNPPEAWHRRQAEVYRKRLAADLKADHKGGADHWQGAASAETRSLAQHAQNPPKIRKLAAIAKGRKKGRIDQREVSPAAASAILKIYDSLGDKDRQRFGKAHITKMAQVARSVARRV